MGRLENHLVLPTIFSKYQLAMPVLVIAFVPLRLRVELFGTWSPLNKIAVVVQNVSQLVITGLDKSKSRDRRGRPVGFPRWPSAYEAIQGW